MSNKFKIKITRRIPYIMTYKIIIKQMLLRPNIFIIAPIFTIDNFVSTGFNNELRVTPKTAIIVAGTPSLTLQTCPRPSSPKHETTLSYNDTPKSGAQLSNILYPHI